MALDPVPWFIGGGAEHSAAAARNLAWNATNGATGISTPTSLQVRQTPTASNSVQIMPGGATIESTYFGALQQSYTVRNGAAFNVDIPVNTESTTITRLVWVEINDPTYAGPQPPSVPDGPYVFIRHGTSVPETHPTLLLASIKVRPNTTILADDIVDARVMANPRRQEVMLARPRVAADNSPQNYLNSKSSAGEYFPGGADYFNEADTRFPTWCNSVIVEAGWYSVYYESSKKGFGEFWIEWGDAVTATDRSREFKTQEFRWDQSEGNAGYRTNWLLADTRQVPASLRGKNTKIVFKARNNASSSAQAGTARMDALSGQMCRLTFLEAPADWEDFN